MPGNYRAVVDQLIRQSSVARESTSSGFGPGAYEDALEHMWSGDFARATELVSTMLADDPEADRRFAAYRLWTEALAERADRAGLAALREHLFLRGQAEPGDHETYAALRGIVHLELDEFSAAKLLARALYDADHNAYALELVQRVDSRAATAPTPALLRCTTPVDDYFQWQSLARGLLITRDEDSVNRVLTHVQSHFRGAPLPHVFEFHRLVETGLYAGAALVAERLSELYPQNLDFRYYHAYALFEDGDYPAARRLLNDAVRHAGDNDAEIVGLLGHCNAKLGDPERAATLLRKAASLLKADGLPTSHISLELANVEDELRGDRLDPALEMPRMTRKWLVNLSPRRYHEFATASDSAIDRLLRPMGKEPQPGDICFFATTSNVGGQSQWRIVGIYAVDSMPMWHPTVRYHSALKLISRLPVGIPVDVEGHESEDAEPTDQVERDAPINFGVYELDNHAIDIIEQAVRLSRDEMIERRSGSRQQRPTA